MHESTNILGDGQERKIAVSSQINPHDLPFVRSRKSRFKMHRKKFVITASGAMTALPQLEEELSDFERSLYLRGAEKLNAGLKCGQRVQAGVTHYCDSPLVCLRCMNYRLVRLANLVLDLNEPVAAQCLRKGFIFPRGIGLDQGKAILLKRIQVDDSTMLSDSEFVSKGNYGDMFYAAVETGLHCVTQLSKERNDAVRAMLRRKYYFGSINQLRVVPQGNRCVLYEWRSVSFFKPGSKTIWTPHKSLRREPGIAFNYMTVRESVTKPEIVTKDNLLSLLDRQIVSDGSRLNAFMPEEVLAHLGILSSSKIMTVSGPIFRPKNQKNIPLFFD